MTKNSTAYALSCMSAVGWGGSILFRHILPFPVYATVCLSLIGFGGGRKVMASQHGFKFQISLSGLVIRALDSGNRVWGSIKPVGCSNVMGALSHHSLVPSLRTAWDIFSVFEPCFFITTINRQCQVPSLRASKWEICFSFCFRIHAMVALLKDR